MKKILGGTVATIVIIAIIILIFSKGFGLGGGSTGSGKDNELKQQETNAEEADESREDLIEIEELSKVVIVTIKENQVFVGNKEFSSEADLKKYIEEINSDGRKFKLKEENSILDTYEWVTKVFEELKIPLLPIEN